MNNLDKQLARIITPFPQPWQIFVTSDLVNYVINNPLLDNTTEDSDIKACLINSVLAATGNLALEELAIILFHETEDLSEEVCVMFATEIIQQIFTAAALLASEGIQLSFINPDDEMPVPKPPKYTSPKSPSRVAEIRPKPHQGSGDPYREIPEA